MDQLAQTCDQVAQTNSRKKKVAIVAGYLKNLDDEDLVTRGFTVRALAEAQAQSSIPALSAMQKDPDPGVAEAVRRTIESLRSYRFMNPDKKDVMD